jgi:flagellar biosynthesis protein FliR
MQGLLSELTQSVDATRNIVVFALIMARVMAIVILVPFLGGKNAPTEVKMGVGVALTMIIWPTAISSLTGDVPMDAIGFTFMMLKETFVGIVIGFVAAEIFYTVEIAGQLVDLTRGANQIQLQVPEIQERSSAFGSLNFQLLLALFLAMGMHRPFMWALFESFVAIPLNDFPNFQAGFWPFVDFLARVTADVLFVAVLIAMPVGVVCLVCEATFGLINRVAPQINAYFMAMPAKVLGGCLLFFFSLQMILELMVKHSAVMLLDVQHVIELME